MVEKDIKEPRVSEVVIERTVADVLRLRRTLGAKNQDVTEEELTAWTTAAMPAFIAAEQRLHELGY
jgi:hypothetical protein